MIWSWALFKNFEMQLASNIPSSHFSNIPSSHFCWQQNNALFISIQVKTKYLFENRSQINGYYNNTGDLVKQREIMKCELRTIIDGICTARQENLLRIVCMPGLAGSLDHAGRNSLNVLVGGSKTKLPGGPSQAQGWGSLILTGSLAGC